MHRYNFLCKRNFFFSYSNYFMVILCVCKHGIRVPYGLFFEKKFCLAEHDGNNVWRCGVCDRISSSIWYLPMKFSKYNVSKFDKNAAGRSIYCEENS